MSTRTDRYAVMGNPVSHSKSPRIHTLFAAQTGQDLEYTAIEVEPGCFHEAVDAFRDGGGRGLNVTVPFKQEAWVHADILSARAERAGAVNTLVFRDDGEVYGENTDGLGLVRDLKANLGVELSGARVLLLGAGGAARGVLQPLLGAGPAALTVANRTPEKAAELALLFDDLGAVSASALTELEGRGFDLVLNATAASLEGGLPALPAGVLAAGGVAYDLMYGNEPTAFVRWGWEQGASLAADGLGMLVEQAAESFEIWRGVRPDTTPVLDTLRKERGW